MSFHSYWYQPPFAKSTNWLHALYLVWLMQRNGVSVHPAKKDGNALPLINNKLQCSVFLGKLGPGYAF